MRKLIVLTFLTLDGVMQAPGGPDEDRESGFTQGGWSVGYWDSVMDAVMTKQMGHPFDLLLGRKTYDIFAAYWPQSKDPGAEALNKAHKYVVSRTRKTVTWENSTCITGDVVEGIRNIKKEDGQELQVHGSANLIQTLLKHDLVDEFWLKIFPIVVGPGKRLFGEGTIPAAFKQTESSVSTTGIITANYIWDGAIKTGSF
jgi:dihydrofolate reductase